MQYQKPHFTSFGRDRKSSGCIHFSFFNPQFDLDQRGENPFPGKRKNKFDRVFHIDQLSSASGSDIHKGFTAIPAYSTGLHPTAVVMDDFNGDGRKDLAVSHFGSIISQDSTGEITILQGNTNNTFTISNSFNAGIHPVSLVTGDFNGDEKRDLAISNFGSNTVSIFLGNGDRSFGIATHFKVGLKPFRLTTGDFNKDGIADLAVPNFGSNTISILIGNGTGTFGNSVSEKTGNGPVSAAVGDFNLDGKEDIVVANFYDNTVSIFLGNGDGAFMKKFDFPVDTAPSMVIAEDLNRDGILDLAIANMGSNSISVLLGKLEETPLISYENITIDKVISNPSALIVNDFNDDGQKDIAVTNFGGLGVKRRGEDISILLGNGDGRFNQTLKDVVVGVSPISATSGDLDGNQTIDLVTTNFESNNITVLSGNGDGTFGPFNNYPAGKGAHWIASGDFNLDGNSDLVTANIDATNISALLGNGDGSYKLPEVCEIQATVHAVTPGDLNYDGVPDLVTANISSNTITLLHGNGDGTFSIYDKYFVGPSRILFVSMI